MTGLNAESKWATEARGPAVQAVDEPAAVATKLQESSGAAAERFTARRACADPQRLIADDEIDVLAVVSPVATHRDLVLAALHAGKTTGSNLHLPKKSRNRDSSGTLLSG